MVAVVMQVSLLQSAVSEMFAQVSETGMLTLADRYGILAAVMAESLDEEDRKAIDRLLRAIYQGRVQVVNELSTLI